MAMLVQRLSCCARQCYHIPHITCASSLHKSFSTDGKTTDDTDEDDRIRHRNTMKKLVYSRWEGLGLAGNVGLAAGSKPAATPSPFKGTADSPALSASVGQDGLTKLKGALRDRF